MGLLDDVLAQALGSAIERELPGFLEDLRRSVRTHNIDLEIEELEPGVFRIVAVIRPKGVGKDAEKD